MITFFQRKTHELGVGSLNGHLQHQAAASTETLSPWAHSLFLKPLKLWDDFVFFTHGQLSYGLLMIKKCSSCLFRHYHCYKWLFSARGWAWPTAHWIISFLHMAWIRMQSPCRNSPKLQPSTTHRMFSTDYPQKVHATFNLKLEQRQ